MKRLRWEQDAQRLTSGTDVFDPRKLEWQPTEESTSIGEDVTPLQAISRLAAGRLLRRVPIGIIGPREATREQCDFAEKLAGVLAEHDLQLVCGGKNGVMEAACRGHAAKGGMPVGILPDEEWQAANDYVAIPIATGIGPARNAIIARACVVLVAIGGGVGTLSEMALGLQFKRLVLATAGAPVVNGVPVVSTVEEILDRVAIHLLQVDVS
ncbi:TIGR00725 family protein [Agrobacterium rubi]|uniref:TIGR00725 family protein n=2 Tax=Agrobacterium rubi TaxID=28099 RepID=A0ABX2JDE0_9HYPH|nr:TIGR00725 family protein [Agrobacterium rubi]NTF39466.1 TIGR00725 family protein [Agrobacterium rubi]